MDGAHEAGDHEEEHVRGHGTVGGGARRQDHLVRRGRRGSPRGRAQPQGRRLAQGGEVGSLGQRAGGGGREGGRYALRHGAAAVPWEEAAKRLKCDPTSMYVVAIVLGINFFLLI